MSPLNLKKRDYVLLYFALGLFFVWLVARVVLNPFHEKLSDLEGEVSQEKGKLKKGIGLIEKKETINREYGKYASYFSLENVSDDEAVSRFLREIESIGRESRVTIVDMKPQKETESDKFSKQYQINIKAEGNMVQLVNFLYALQHSELLLSVEKLVLSPKTDNQSDLNITLTLVGVAFL